MMCIINSYYCFIKPTFDLQYGCCIDVISGVLTLRCSFYVGKSFLVMRFRVTQCF